MTRAFAIAVVAMLGVMLGACSDPPFTLRFRVTHNPAAACFDSSNQQVTACADVTMQCRAVVSIRVFSPNDPASPYISVCKELTGQANVCAIAGVDLPQPAIPVNVQTLEVEMLVYPLSAVTSDPNTGDLQCPTGAQFDSLGFPVAAVQPCAADTGLCEPTPAIGGIAFYHPGDSETVVDLGCTDLSQLNDPVCTGQPPLSVTATVNDFDTEVSVQPALADRLTVSIGEPKAVTVGTDITYQLNVVDTHPLTRTGIQPVPSWTGSVDQQFGTACLEVLEDGAGTTASLRCSPVPESTKDIQPTGTRLAKSTLAEIVSALGLTQFPDQGLVVGMVLDFLGNPVANLEVTTTGGTVQYLAADRLSTNTTATSSNGIFISQDAPYLTMFRATSTLATRSSLGGLVDGKVTIVVLQLDKPPGM